MLQLSLKPNLILGKLWERLVKRARKQKRGNKDREEETGRGRKVYCPLWTWPLLDSYKWLLFPVKHSECLQFPIKEGFIPAQGYIVTR